MQRPRSRKKRNHFPVVVAACALAFAGGAVYAVKDRLTAKAGSGYAAGEITGSLAASPQQLGPSGLPLPRFVTLKANKVNVRRGPSSDHEVAFVFQRKGLPVEITAEFENWRKIRDSEGTEGWILQSMLSGRRTAYVAQWTKEQTLTLRDDKALDSAVAARLEPGVLANIESCDGRWCEIEAEGHTGYAEQEQLWGVYPGEVID